MSCRFGGERPLLALERLDASAMHKLDELFSRQAAPHPIGVDFRVLHLIHDVQPRGPMKGVGAADPANELEHLHAVAD